MVVDAGMEKRLGICDGSVTVSVTESPFIANIYTITQHSIELRAQTMEVGLLGSNPSLAIFLAV